MTAHAWIKDDKIAVTADDGKIIILESNGELKHQHVLGTPIHTIEAFSKGFIVGDIKGTLLIYQLEENSKKTKIVEGSNNSTTSIYAEMFKKPREIRLGEEDNSIIGISISAAEDGVICSTSANNIFGISLATNPELKSEDSKLISFHLGYHHGPILCADACIRKPLLVTASTDHSIRIWNFVEKSCELVKYFSEDIFSVSIHPSGLYVLIGFADKLRLMNLLMDDLRCVKEFSVRSCRAVSLDCLCGSYSPL